MKKLYTLFLFCSTIFCAQAQTPFQRVYTTLNTKCQSSTCHSATSTGDNLKFDGSSAQVYNSILNVPSGLFPASVAKFEQLVKPQHPYTSFLLRKISGAQFDTDLSLEASGEGNLMLDTAGQPLTKTEIEFVRQWIRYGALQTYASTDPQPDYATINRYYTDTTTIAFLPKPPKPAAGTGIQFRMGPVFLPTTGATEQEWLEQQEVNFPFESEIYKITGNMNTQSHHFILFQYADSLSARSAAGQGGNKPPDLNNMTQITPNILGVLGTNSFNGNKNITGAWQEDADVDLPQGTGLMWDRRTWLDMNFHVKNYNATSVLPCDFYFNIYFHPRSPTTVPMIAHLVNNFTLGQFSAPCLLQGAVPPYVLPDSTSYTQIYNDGDNGGGETRYLWMAAGHTHKYGTAYYIIVRDTTGALADTIYDGQYDYVNNAPIGYWDHAHPPLEYWPNLRPVIFGKNNSGLAASTSWFSQEKCIHFGFTTSDEMQLFYYMYTTQLPGTAGINEAAQNAFNFQIQPNPMSNNGKLVYVLDKSSKVEASIIDITGKIIAELNSENQQEGAHTIEISNGHKIAAGIYFARLSVNGVAITKKFVVTE